MRICLICTEFFGLGSAGGFGFATRILGRELAKRGVEVYAVIPHPRGAEETSVVLDGVHVKTFPRLDLFGSMRLYKDISIEALRRIAASHSK